MIVVLDHIQQKSFARAYKTEGEARFEELSIIFAPAAIEVVMLSSDEEPIDEELPYGKFPPLTVDLLDKGKEKMADGPSIKMADGPSIKIRPPKSGKVDYGPFMPFPSTGGPSNEAQEKAYYGAFPPISLPV